MVECDRELSSVIGTCRVLSRQKFSRENGVFGRSLKLLSDSQKKKTILSRTSDSARILDLCAMDRELIAPTNRRGPVVWDAHTHSLDITRVNINPAQLDIYGHVRSCTGGCCYGSSSLLSFL
jgi:hypothetical protein